MLCFRGRFKKDRPTSSSSSTSSIISQFFSRLPGNKASDKCVKSKLPPAVSPPSIATLQKHYSGTSSAELFPVTSPPSSHSKPSPLSDVTTLQHYNSCSSSNDTTSPSDRPAVNLSSNTLEFPAFMQQHNHPQQQQQQQSRNSVRSNNQQLPWQQQQPIMVGLNLKTLEHIYEEPRYGAGRSREENPFGVSPSSSFSFVGNNPSSTNFQSSNQHSNIHQTPTQAPAFSSMLAKQRKVAGLYPDSKVPVEVMSTLSTHASRRPSLGDVSLMPPSNGTDDHQPHNQPFHPSLNHHQSPTSTPPVHCPPSQRASEHLTGHYNFMQSALIEDDDTPTLYLDNDGGPHGNQPFGQFGSNHNVSDNNNNVNKPIFINPLQYVLANSIKNPSSNHSDSPTNVSYNKNNNNNNENNRENYHDYENNQNYTSTYNNKNNDFYSNNNNNFNNHNSINYNNKNNNINHSNNYNSNNIVRKTSVKTSQGEVLLNAAPSIRATCV